MNATSGLIGHARFFFSALLMCLVTSMHGATITSTATGGTWSTGSTWIGGVAPSTNDTAIIASGALVNLTGGRTVMNLTINVGGTLNISTINNLTVTGNFINNGTFTGTTGRLYLTGTAGNFTNAGAFTFGAGRIYFYGNVLGFGTHTLAGTQVRFYGNATQSIAAFSTSGLISMFKTGGTATCLGGIVGNGGLTINGAGATLHLGTSLTHSFSRVTLSNGTLHGGSSTINITSVSNSAWSGGGFRFTAGTSTVRMTAAGNQTISATACTFNNLTFSTSGVKTISTGNCLVNGIVSMEGTATVSAAPTYGSAATLIYNTTVARTVGAEWPSTYSGSGGVIVNTAAHIAVNAAKVMNVSSPLTINNGATVLTNNFQLTFGGNFVNNGTFTAGSSPIVIANTMATQTIAPFVTTGLVSMTKTAGTASFGGNITAGGLTINGAGGTLNMGAQTHTFNGVITLTNGTLNGGSSTINQNAVSASAWNGTGSRFTAGTSTVNFGAAGNQTISASATTFYNLTFSNTGLKTLTTTTCTISNIASIEGTATVSAAPTYGASARLQYNTTTSRTAGVEWITPFAAAGGVATINTGVITMNTAKVFNLNVPLTIATGAAIATGNFQVNFGGNFVNSGTLTAGSSPIIIDNTMSVQSIGGFSTTGVVSMTKPSGTATLTGTVSGSGLTINGTFGVLHLGANLTHTFSGNLTRTAGTLHGGSSSLRIGGAVSGTGGVFTAATGTFDYSGAGQLIVVLPYYGLTLSGSGTKTFAGMVSASNTISIATGVVANLGTFTHSAVGLSLGGVVRSTGSWGGTGSAAANITATFFAATSGRINNNCSVPTITGQPISPEATCSGTGVLTMTVTASGSGLTYSWRKGGVAVVNGGTISGQGTATLTLTAPALSDAGSYDVVVTDTCPTVLTSNSVTVTVNASPVYTTQPSASLVCQNTATSFTVATTATSPTYQWQYSSQPVTNWANANALIGVSGSTSATLSLTNIPLTYNNTNFRCIVTALNGCASNSNAALSTVNAMPTVGAITGNQAICSGYTPASDITLASASGTIQWQSADNAGFTVGLTNIGSNSTKLTPNQVGIITATKYIRAVVSNGVCMVTTSGTATITVAATAWTSAGGGSWSNGVPNSTTAAVFSYDYTSAGDLTACTIIVNNGANVIISTGDNVSLTGALTVASGSFTLSNNSNLVQLTDVANSGAIIIKRETAPLMRQDYCLWSSPVTGQQLQSFSPNTLATRFYTYLPSSNVFSVVASPSSTNFDVGTGYLIRLPNNHPATPLIWTGSFTGVANNGSYSIPVTAGTYNAIGNPYPSAIDADTFITDNGVTEALYFWRKTNNAATSSYATYTLAGGVSNSAGDPLGLIPNGVIQVGQGFIAKATSSSFDFTNSMRIEDSSNQFFRLAAPEDKNRVWLNLTSSTGYFGQMLVAYMNNATLEVDPGIDGRYFNDCATALTSLINNEEFTIQGRPLPFDANDVVTLGFKASVADSYTISINQVDGFFETDHVPVYLKDNYTNTIHNLSTGNYDFASEMGVFNDRFELIYDSFLATTTPAFSENNVIVYKKNRDIVVNSGDVTMTGIQVYDLGGRLLMEKHNLDAQEVQFNLGATNQVVLVKILTGTHGTITKKIVN